MSNQFKIFLLVALSFLSSFNLGTNDTFFSIENKGASVCELANAGGSFAKLSTKSSLSTSLFNQLDNALASSPFSIRFDYGLGLAQTPRQFLNEVGDGMHDLILSNGAYAKFDKTTGRMLYSDGTNQYFIHYPNGNNVSNLESLMNTRVTQLRNYLGLNGNQTIQLNQGLAAVTTRANKVTTFVGKQSETQLLKDYFGNFKHIEVGETLGAVNLLNRPNTYFNGPTWFADYNKGWMVRSIQRGDDIYIASKIDANSLYNIKPDGSTYGSYYANELNELVTAGVKPKNILQTEWDALIDDITQAAATKY